MTVRKDYRGIEEELRYIIRAKARRLCRGRRFVGLDEPDIENDIWVAVLERLGRYDSSLGSLYGFVMCLVDNAICDIIREMKQRHVSTRRWQTRHAKRFQRHYETACPLTGVTSDSSYAPDRYDQVNDIDVVLRTLPDNLRQISMVLMFESVTEVARKSSIPRTTMIYREMRKIREAFEDAGFSKSG